MPERGKTKPPDPMASWPTQQQQAAREYLYKCHQVGSLSALFGQSYGSRLVLVTLIGSTEDRIIYKLTRLQEDIQDKYSREQITFTEIRIKPGETLKSPQVAAKIPKGTIPIFIKQG